MANSLKDQAEEIAAAVNSDIEDLERDASQRRQVVDGKAHEVLETLFKAVSDVDLAAAGKRVEALKLDRPEATSSELVRRLIQQKCQATAAVGAVTSSAGLMPGLGTATAVVLGVAADLGATFKLQAELVLEIAALYNYPLTDSEKQRLVFLVTGLNAGTSALTRRVGRAASVKIGERMAGKAVLKALPVVGIIASAGTNVLATYIIGQRADAYFRLGPETMGGWRDSLRAITGVDERNIGRWLAEGGKSAGTALSRGAGKVKATGKSAGAVVSGGFKLGGRNVRPEFMGGWRWIFGLIVRVLKFLWASITFVPRRIKRIIMR